MFRKAPDFEVCNKFFFIESCLGGDRATKIDGQGRKFVEYDGKWCRVRKIPLVDLKGPIEILKSGR